MHGTLNGRSSSGYIWKNGIYSEAENYSFQFTANALIYGNRVAKSSGFPLRCAARLNRKRTALTTGSSLTNADTPLLSFPLSYIRSGWYDSLARWGTLCSRSSSGFLINSTALDSGKKSTVAAENGRLIFNNELKAQGHPLRYVARFNSEETSSSTLLQQGKERPHHRLQPHER